MGLGLIGADVVSLRAWGRRSMQQLERLARELSEVQRLHGRPPAPPVLPPSDGPGPDSLSGAS
jgi:hypothetical protein